MSTARHTIVKGCFSANTIIDNHQLLTVNTDEINAALVKLMKAIWLHIISSIYLSRIPTIL